MKPYHYHWYNTPLAAWQLLLLLYGTLLLGILVMGVAEKRSGRLQKKPLKFHFLEMEDEYAFIAGIMVLGAAGFFFFHFDAPFWLALLEGLPVGISLFVIGAIVIEAHCFAVFWLLKRLP